MTWLLAVVLRPLGAVAFFGLAALVAILLRPLIPNGRAKQTLYDRTWRHRHKWAFAAMALVGVYGTVFLMVYLYS